jgi:hypothetical protein
LDLLVQEITKKQGYDTIMNSLTLLQISSTFILFIQSNRKPELDEKPFPPVADQLELP